MKQWQPQIFPAMSERPFKAQIIPAMLIVVWQGLMFQCLEGTAVTDRSQWGAKVVEAHSPLPYFSFGGVLN